MDNSREDYDDYQQLFQIAEMTGRDLFQRFRDRKDDFDLKFSNPIMGYKHDGHYTSGLTTALFELKKRNVEIMHYPSARIEKDKYDYLTWRVTSTEEAKSIGVLPYYINIWTDGYISMFNLNDITPKWEWKWCPKESMSGKNKMELKLVYDIPMKQATIYHLNFELYN